MSQKKIISSATSDLVSDQRVHRVCNTLKGQGFEIQAVGREIKGSLPVGERTYSCSRIRPFITKGPLFYFEYNIRLFFFLMRKEVDILLSNDLDTLLANVLVSRIRKIPIVYDSHEYFTEVPELINRSSVRNFWLRIEKFCFKHINLAFTVSEPIAKEYNSRYDLNFITLRNFPEKLNLDTVKKEISENIKVPGKKVILYQGSVNVDRGLEEMLEAMKYLDDCQLIIIGEGDIYSSLKEKVQTVEWGHRIRLLGKKPFELLPSYTIQADLGISIEKDNGLSYTYAMPNKLFDYIQVGIPSLITSLPEMKKVNEKYEIAEEIQRHDPKEIAKTISNLFSNEKRCNELKNNALKAREELNWDVEKEILLKATKNSLDRV